MLGMGFIGASLFVAITSLSAHTPAKALTGEDLLRQCSAESEPKKTQCRSYIAGVAEGVDTLSTSMRLLHSSSPSYPRLFCVGDRTPTELVRATKTYLLQNPDGRRFN